MAVDVTWQIRLIFRNLATGQSKVAREVSRLFTIDSKKKENGVK